MKLWCFETLGDGTQEWYDAAGRTGRTAGDADRTAGDVSSTTAIRVGASKAHDLKSHTRRACGQGH